MSTALFQQARITKDGNFDGRFFFGVVTTGIFCRPSCPSPTAKEDNVRYFNSLFDALENGFRPCLRCRPDISLDYYSSTNTDGVYVVETALVLIYQGFLNNHSVEELAQELLVSDRHLRKLFNDTLGTSPIAIANYHRALFAKKLLLTANMAISDIAFAAGFGSLRQFNDVFRKIFGMSPTKLRNTCLEKRINSSGTVRLLLPYNSPFSFNEILDFLRPRAIQGVERITEACYSRTFRMGVAKGFFSVTDKPDISALELLVDCNDITCLMELHAKVGRMFDLHTDFSHINKLFQNDSILSKGLVNGYVPRLTVAFNPFEFVIRAILGQQISIKAATTLAGRVAKKANIILQEGPTGLNYFFPEPEELLPLDLDGLGITRKRQETIKHTIKALLDNKLHLRNNQQLGDFSKDFSTIHGIGMWTVNYVAMRGLGIRDAFPASDLGIIKALSKNRRTTPNEIESLAERWRPYRSYAALCLWNSLSKKE